MTLFGRPNTVTVSREACIIIWYPLYLFILGEGLLDGVLAGVGPGERGPPIHGARRHPLGQA